MLHGILLGIGIALGLWIFNNLGTVLLDSFGLMVAAAPLLKKGLQLLYFLGSLMMVWGLLETGRMYGRISLLDAININVNANGGPITWTIGAMIYVVIGWKLFK